MKYLRKLHNYLNEEEIKITFYQKKLNIENYIKVNDFSNKEISIQYENGLILVKGENLVITRMLKDEILISGDIKNIELR